MISVPILKIIRHCINVDGPGITTLVGFYGCPLHCQYCLNPNCHSKEHISIELNPEELFSKVKIDDIYFKATNGGITFGGGEPLLYDKFIKAFSNICDKEWNLNIETSLNVESTNLINILPIIDNWIVDIKDLNNKIYSRYTGYNNKRVLKNLEILSSNNIQQNVLIRLPLIKNYNDEKSRNNSLNKIKEMGFKKIDLFEYVINNNEQDTEIRL